MADQLTTVSKSRFDGRFGEVSQSDMYLVSLAISVHLGL